MASKTRERLIETARQLFTNKGVAHTTMNDIANASAKGRRTIYTYFKNKREIYNAVIEAESERLVESMRTIASAGMPVEQRLAMFMRARLERYYAPAASASLKAWMKFDRKRVERIRYMALQKEGRIFVRLLAEGVRDGVFRRDRCKLLGGFLTVSETVHDAHALVNYDDNTRKNVIDDFVDFVITDITVDK